MGAFYWTVLISILFINVFVGVLYKEYEGQHANRFEIFEDFRLNYTYKQLCKTFMFHHVHEWIQEHLVRVLKRWPVIERWLGSCPRTVRERMTNFRQRFRGHSQHGSFRERRPGLSNASRVSTLPTRQ